MPLLVTSLGLALLWTPTAVLAYGPPPPPPGSPPGAAPIQAPPSSPATSPRPGSPAPRGATPPAPPDSAAGRGDDRAAPEAEPTKPIDLGGTWTYSRSAPEQPRLVRARDDVDTAANPEGYYSGVSIEGNHVPPFPAARMGTKPASMTWTGFERVGDGSRVFFEVSADVATKLEIKGAVVTVRLSNTRINVRNNARYLDLRYFRTPVRSVKVSRRGRDALATIVLKQGAEPKLSWIAGKAGYRLLVLDFAGDESTESVGEAIGN